MNFLTWNCRGASGHNFRRLIKYYVKMHNFDFIMLLKPRISGTKDDVDIRKIEFPNSFKFDANGFSNGIWRLWQFLVQTYKLSTHKNIVYIYIKVNVGTLYDDPFVLGTPMNQTFDIAFANCIEYCNLINFDFFDDPFTMMCGQLQERLGRVLCGKSYSRIVCLLISLSLPLITMAFGFSCVMVNFIPNETTSKKICAWLEHPDFDNQVKHH